MQCLKGLNRSAAATFHNPDPNFSITRQGKTPCKPWKTQTEIPPTARRATGDVGEKAGSYKERKKVEHYWKI